MSLKVWLPLNGNLENKGISDYSFSSSNYTLDNNGKIGKCYKHLNCNITNLGNLNIYPMTICFWMKTSDTSSAWQKIVMFDNSSLSQIHGIYVADSARVKYEYNPSLNVYNADIGNWHHYAFVINNNKSEAYYDGVLSITSTEAITSEILGRIRIAEAANVYLNDFRIYDHCLSQKEVKEISQGLVLHYKLNGFFDGVGENLGNTSATYSNQTLNTPLNASTWGGDAGTVTYYASGGYNNLPYKEYHKTATGTGGIYRKTNNDIILEEGVTYTMSVYVKSSRNYTDSHYSFNINRGSDNYYITYGSSIPFTTSWTRLTKTFTVGEGYGGSYGEMSIIYNDDVTDYYVYYSGFKIEKGDKATEWTPPFSSLNIDTTKITDSSGYGNHGIINGSLSTINNSNKYNASMVFKGSATDFIYRPVLTCLKNNFTISCWGLIKTLPQYRAMLVSNGGKDSISHGVDLYINSSGLPYFMIANNNTAYYAGSTTALNTNTWYLFTCTYNGTVMKLYINGELKKSTNTTIEPDYDTTPIAFTIGKMGHSYTNTDGYFMFDGYINDVRVYATALSENDIKVLYDTPTWIDKNNSWHTCEFYETTQGRELMGGKPFTDSYGNHNYLTNPFTSYNENGEMIFTKTIKNAGSDYIKINPTGKTYCYDCEISVSAGNQFYIGFHRYDAQKTSRSNDATVYIVNIKPSNDLIHKRYFGIIDLATDGVNLTDAISLRILNNWNGSTSDGTGTATIHYLSLREVDGTINTNPEITKNGLIKTDTFRQWDDDEARIYKNGFIGGNNLIEI